MIIAFYLFATFLFQVGYKIDAPKVCKGVFFKLSFNAQVYWVGLTGVAETIKTMKPTHLWVCCRQLFDVFYITAGF